MIRSCENPKKREALAKLRRGKITIAQAAKFAGVPVSGIVGWAKLEKIPLSPEYLRPRRAPPVVR
ncbi:MAG: hypothetical protein AB7U61_00955 [Methylocystis sp.]